jgi:Membrane MotB of proton-channel complex MotA/MotB
MSKNVGLPTVPDLDLDPQVFRKTAAPHPSPPEAPHRDSVHDDQRHGAGAEHPESSHGEAHHGKKHGHGGHGGGHGVGGHGGNWLVTYCDMITLLIAFFICILTFSSKENGKQSCPKLRDSLIYGPGGTGAIGPKGANADSIVWRQVLASVNPYSLGSRTAPSHSDPQMASNDQVLDMLDHSTSTVLDDSFSFRVPLVVLMNDARTFSPAGKRLLGNIAFSLRQFPFDVIIQIEDKDVFATAFLLSKHLTELAGCPPSRAGISLLDDGAGRKDSVRFLFVSRQK